MSLLLSSIAACILGFMTFTSYLSQNRGTNAVTRFVRDSVNSHKQTLVLFWSLAAGVMFTLTAMIGKNQWWSGIPCFVVSGINIALLVKSTRNKQRVQDARTVTKGSLKATGQVSEGIGTAAGTALDVYATTKGIYTNGAGVAFGKSLGESAGNVMTSCADQMTDVNSPEFDLSAINQIMTDEEFLSCASKLGIKTDGVEVKEVANEVYKYIPDFYKDRHSDKSVETVTCNFLQGVS